MKRYEAYKDSGADWIREIPEGWEVVRFKRLFKEKRKITDASLNSGSISFGEVVYKDDEKITEATKLSYQVLNEGEFLLNPLNMNYDLKSLRIGLSTINVVVSSGYIILQSKKGLNKNYYRWLLRMYDIVFMKTLGAGVRQTINYSDLADSHLVVPSFDEQQAIAEFLDNKTAKIDQTIGIRQKEIELLKERRQILIQEAVTKGLDATVAMKDSGVDWIGEIPEHWEVRKLKYHASKIGSGITPSGGATTYLDEGIPLLRSQNVYFDRFEFGNVAYIAEKTHREMSNSKVQKNDILLNITGGSIGRCNIFKYDFEANVNQHVCIVRPKNIYPNYLNLLLSSSLGQFQVFFQQQGGGREGLNFQNLKNFYFPISPLAEQTQIVIYLEDIEAKIAKAITLKEQEIEKLKEYKTVLIDQVVTGKVKIN
ncbi:restriction endonuclease subunit S [Chryseobacterium sp. RG1]|uniref:Restriction endonuclease subunit S n=1 Tax=Chryseobacterium tagetis TaxID=2801334 RepID=A0ABS7ZZG5_9FLAO|nr:restriction endonuclease subunit S [Chryseobacterium tagetis]MCA6066572.1 restriction endonuclease subunit S [Chryseobacterium tagetis]